MNATLSPAKAAYLRRVAVGLGDLPEEDRDEVLHELEAHLAELQDDQVEATLGEPERFVAEFRATAGLYQPEKEPPLAAWRRFSARVAAEVTRLSARLDWPRFRPAWIWIRGWVVVSGLSLLYYNEGFTRFPIPEIGNSSLTGLTLVVLATGVSVWLDRRSTGARATASTALSALAAVALAASALNPVYQASYVEVPYYPEQLMAPTGEPVWNIYAYDLDGEPVDVLLFDQTGRPLRAFPEWVYFEAEASSQPVQFGEGAVTLPRDEYGRIIPNLYPLEISTYDQYGRLQPMPPPSLGFPPIQETGRISEETTPTTVARGQ